MRKNAVGNGHVITPLSSLTRFVIFCNPLSIGLHGCACRSKDKLEISTLGYWFDGTICELKGSKDVHGMLSTVRRNAHPWAS